MRLLAAVAALSCLLGCAPDTVPSSQRAVEERLACQCGCGLTVHTCNHLQCSFGEPVKKDIATSLAAGQTGEQILARYVAQYGEKILSSPTSHGFNLLAWYGPYVAIAFSAVLVVLMLRRWHAASVAAPGEIADRSTFSDAQRERLKRELERLDQ